MIQNMTKYDYLIIGGGITGVIAAETIREKKPTAAIGIVSDEPHMIYSRVLLPSFLKKKISREQLFLRKPEDFTEKNIDLHLGQHALRIDPQRKEVALSAGVSFRYDKLLIASGGKVRPWGEEKDQHLLYRLQTLDDAERLHEALPRIRQPIVVGSSFISLEFLEIFFLAGISSVLLSRGQHFFANVFESKGGELMYKNFDQHGIQMYFGDTIKDISEKDESAAVVTSRLRQLSCDAIALGVGIRRNVEFLKEAGIEFGSQGILANEFLETNIPGIFAAGDVAEFYDVILGIHRIAGNWTNAFLQGKHAGLVMAGVREPFRQVSSYAITNLGLQITVLGKTHGDPETIVRVDEATSQYERFFIENGVLVGAALINRFHDKPHLVKLIETKTPIDAYRENLADSAFDIKNIPVVS